LLALVSYETDEEPYRWIVDCVGLVIG
jgi:hypothetical protein